MHLQIKKENKFAWHFKGHQWQRLTLNRNLFLSQANAANNKICCRIHTEENNTKLMSNPPQQLYHFTSVSVLRLLKVYNHKCIQYKLHSLLWLLCIIRQQNIRSKSTMSQSTYPDSIEWLKGHESGQCLEIELHATMGGWERIYSTWKVCLGRHKSQGTRRGLTKLPQSAYANMVTSHLAKQVSWLLLQKSSQEKSWQLSRMQGLCIKHYQVCIRWDVTGQSAMNYKSQSYASVQRISSIRYKLPNLLVDHY